MQTFETRNYLLRYRKSDKRPAKTIKGLFSWSKLKGDDNLNLF